MDRKRALTSETLTRVFSELDDDDDGELGPRVFCSALQVRTFTLLSLSRTLGLTNRVKHWCLGEGKMQREGLALVDESVQKSRSLTI